MGIMNPIKPPMIISRDGNVPEDLKRLWQIGKQLSVMRMSFMISLFRWMSQTWPHGYLGTNPAMGVDFDSSFPEIKDME